MKANRPTTKKCMQSILGLTGHYINFIPNYSAIASPLADLIRKGLPNEVKWEISQEKTYESLKIAKINYPILHLPDWSRNFK